MGSKKILLLGTHGQHNIGDELLLETFLAQLGTHHTYFINSYAPEFTANQLRDRYNVDVFHTTEDKWQLPRLIWESDYLFFGGGSVIKELYKSVGRNRYATLLMILLIVTFAKWIARKPIIMSNIGVGPINTDMGFFLANLILRQVTLVSVRDQHSYDICGRLVGDQKNIHLTPDAVLVNNASRFEKKCVNHRFKQDKLKIALNLNYDIENGDNWLFFIDTLLLSLNEIHHHIPVEIHALPMQSQFKTENDLKVLTEFKSRLNEKIPMILHEPNTPEEIGEIISLCDLVVAERLHALVIAAILQKPFVALMYDVKVQQLTQFFNMGFYAIDINQPFEHCVLTDSVLTLNRQRHQIGRCLQRATFAAKQNLTVYFAQTVQDYKLRNPKEM